MGKMLDSLVRVVQQQPGHGNGVNPPHRELPKERRTADVSPVAEALPFIEVGAPGKKIEASPDVLAVRVPGAPPAAKEPSPQVLSFAPVREEVKRRLPVPTLVEPHAKIMLEDWPETPTVRIPAEVVTHHHPEHAAAREYVNLLSRLKSTNPHSVLFCGTTPGTDSALVALNLAFAAGRERERAVVVDTDCGAPALGRLTSCENAPGLHDVLAGNVAFADALQDTPSANVHLLVTQAGTPLSREALQWLFAWLRQEFPLVCVIGPAAKAATADLLTLCDALYLVDSSHADVDVSPLASDLLSKGGKLRGLIRWSAATL